MRKMKIAAAFLAGMLAFASCGDSGTNEQETDITGTPTVAGIDSTLTQDRQDLMAFAARNNMLQIELGRLATQQGTTDPIKQYGQQLVDWYTTKQQELQELAQQYNLTLPQQMEEDQLQHVEELRGTQASEFNNKYWEELADAQENAIDEFDSSLKDVEEAEASAFSLWARNTRKELQAQMEQAKTQDFMQEYDRPAGVRANPDESSGARIGDQ
ncbi:DUF4142 domain-containing protein [Pontibacter toksunensis]|uniref:DUF4142 domain-containing protein n=1 Tax=Pontibacter toksunensis TaxID=1332631 RepID=A0ABW6BWU5_9BACT